MIWERPYGGRSSFGSRDDKGLYWPLHRGFFVAQWARDLVFRERRATQMALVTMRQLLDEAAKAGYGVGAFNVNNLEQVQAIMEAARQTQSPVIIQASRGARKYANDRFLYHLMEAATEVYPEISVALHQDHGNSPG